MRELGLPSQVEFRSTFQSVVVCRSALPIASDCFLERLLQVGVLKNMPGEVLTRIIRIEGIEPGAIPLKEYANLLRDLVFVHDRLWLIANQEHFRERLY